MATSTMTDTIITFPKPAARPIPPVRETGIALRDATQLAVPFIKPRRGSASATTPSAIPIDVLYPATKESAPDVVTALDLLAKAIKLLEDARQANKKTDMVLADRYVQRFQSSLSSLFERRSIGDGYGVIINSLHFALVNQHGQPLSYDQLTASWRILKELRNGPFIQFEEALDRVAELEASGLQVDPVAISDFLNDDEEENE